MDNSKTEYTVTQVVAASIYIEEQKTDSDTSETVVVNAETGVHCTETISRYPTVRDLLDVLESDVSLPYVRAAQMIEQAQQHFAMKILRGQHLSEFLTKMAKTIKDPNAKINNEFNLLRWLPRVAEQLQLENEVLQLTSNSQYQGEYGKTITRTVKVIKCQYIQSHNFFTALLVDEQGNVYNYSPKTELNKGATITIKGKVKAHAQDKYNNNYATTYLNYVKVLEE